MIGRNRFLTFPAVIVATLLGVVSGKAIFGPPLEEYWSKKLKLEEDNNNNNNGETSPNK